MWDFLFTYYSLRPGSFAAGIPGYGVTLAGRESPTAYATARGYGRTDSASRCGRAHLSQRADTVDYVARCCAPPQSGPPG